MLKVLLAALALLVAAPAFAQQPNIIFVVADDLDYEQGNWNHYPNLQALANQGLTFRNHFVNNALCCPSRASILRGQYGHNTGIFKNDGMDGGFVRFRNLGRESSTVATWLQAAGYRTALMGKYMNGYQPNISAPRGWTEWHVGGDAYDQFNYDLNENGTVVHYGSLQSDYLQDVLRAKAVDFVQGSSPFFLALWTYSPHGPAPFAARYAAAFPDVTAPRTATYNEPDVSGQPPWLQKQQPMGPAEIAATDVKYRNRLRSMLAVDETLGALVDALQDAGKLGNTYIVFTSDNGFHLGQHRLAHGKWSGFEEDLHVPLLIRGPGVAAGVFVDAMTVNTDFAPTFTELAGATIPAFVDGRSLVPFLGGTPPAIWRRVFLLELRHGPITAANGDLVADGDLVPQDYVQQFQPSFNGVRTMHWSYMRMFNGETALYDLLNDPYQHINVVMSEPVVVAGMARWTDALKTCSGQSCRNAEDTEPQ